MEVAVNVSRDILSIWDDSSQGSTLYPRVLMEVGSGYGVREWKRKWICEDRAALGRVLKEGKDFDWVSIRYSK